MSCYEWESGYIKIPSDQWVGFKKALRISYNKWATSCGYPKKELLNSRDTSLNFGEASINFSDETKTVHWNVGENNHARDYSHEHEIGKEFFRLLSKIKWTTKTGGVLAGNDEYNKDNRYEGGGGNYITMKFGNPKCKAARNAAYGD